MRLTTALFSILFLVGCSTATPAPVVNSCPAPKTYTIPQQQAIVKAWNELPDDSPLQIPLNEWESLRRALK